jgi:hypothetical protein
MVKVCCGINKDEGRILFCSESFIVPKRTMQRKCHLCIPFLGIARRLSPNFHIHVYVSLYFQDQSTYLAAAKESNRSWKYINFSQINECRNRETEHFIYRRPTLYPLEIAVDFLKSL